MHEKILIGVSSCLLGNEVRYDGGHKRDRYITDTLSDYFDFKAYCPETAIGLGIPRPTIQLLLKQDEIRLVESNDSEQDYTDVMHDVSAAYAMQLSDISGYILKSKSPSCGMERVKLYKEAGMPINEGTGLFTFQLMQKQPFLPVEEEGRLNDARIRENFIERVFAFNRWQKLLAEGLTVKGLMDYHRRHKFILLAHNEAIYRELGKMVAATTKDNLAEQAESYMAGFTECMKNKATRKQHVNVLQHAMGYLKKELASDDKAELLGLFEQYARGEVPLVVPITLLKHHFRKSPDDYIDEQFYMSPYPGELMLRNHV